MRKKTDLTKQKELEAIRKVWNAVCEVYQELNAKSERDQSAEKNKSKVEGGESI